MASEIRVNQIQNRSGLSTVSFTDTGAVFSGITTINTELDVGVGGTIFTALPNGRTGIGITNPGTKLDVAGDVRLSAADAEIEFNAGGARLKGRANALSIHTGSGLDSDASEQVRINTTGVGIGTTNPGAKLHVSGTTADQFASILSNPNNRVRGDYQRAFGTAHPVAIIGNNDDTTDGEDGHLVLCSGDLTPTTGQYCGVLEFMAPESGKTNPNSSLKALIIGGLDGSGGSTGGLGGNIQFWTKGDNVSGVGIERLRITSDGNIGIGATNPVGIFYIKAGTNRNFNFDTGGGFGSADLRISALNDAANANVDLRMQAANVLFNSNGSEKVRITSGGNLGIGITNPNADLTILKTVSGGNGALLSIQNRSSTSGSKCGIMFGVDTSDAVWGDVGNAQIIMENTSGANTGQLKFRVYDGADSEAIKIVGDGTGNFKNGVAFARAGIAFDNSWDGYPGIVVFNADGYSNTSNRTEFRIHGYAHSYSSYPGTSGADFGTNLRIDGATYFSSDSRHKTNIVDNPYGLSEILQLQPRKFNRINSQGTIEEDKGDILGFIAQEVKEVIPEAVNYYPEEDTPNEVGWCRAYALSDGYILSTLVNAVKEQNVIIESLKSRIETLESQINN